MIGMTHLFIVDFTKTEAMVVGYCFQHNKDEVVDTQAIAHTLTRSAITARQWVASRSTSAKSSTTYAPTCAQTRRRGDIDILAMLASL